MNIVILMKRILLSLVVAISSINIFSLPSAWGTTTADGRVCTIVGTESADILRGTKKNDVICGLGGDDRITGGKGSDVIDGGSGEDDVEGEEGDDQILGGSEDDFLNGGPGTDVLVGDAGDDGLIGGYGDDSLFGGDEYGNAYSEDNVCEPKNSIRDLVENCGYDSNAPEITALSISPSAVDTSSSAKVVTARFGIRDDLVGILQVDFSLTQGSTNGTGNNYSCHQLNGDFREGEWLCRGTLPKFAPSGRWYVNVRTVDNAFNQKTLSAVDPDLYPDARGYNFHFGNEELTRNFPTHITQSGEGDDSAPELRSFRTSASVIDTSRSGSWVSATFRIVDDLSGTDWVTCSLKNSEGVYFPRMNDPKSRGYAERISGTKRDGIWGCRVYIPQFAPESSFDWQLRIFDFVHHEKYLTSNGANGFSPLYGDASGAEFSGFGNSTVLSQTGDGDENRPQLLSITPSRDYVNTIKKAQNVAFDFRLTDDLSGIREVQCGMSGAVMLKIGRVSGNALDGVYRCLIQLPKGAPRGFYQFEVNAGYDSAGWGLANYTLPSGRIRNGCEINDCPE